LPIYGNDLQSGKLNPAHRQGILSLPGLLTYHASDTSSDPVERGLFIKRQLLCQDVPAPPPQVAQLIAANPINASDKATTTRQKYEAHKTQDFCKSCHSLFDPIGFGLEEMDGLGRYRTAENGLPIDSSGVLASTDVDGPFNGVVELSNKLLNSNEFRGCFVQQFFRFAESRPPALTEQCVIDDFTRTFVADGTQIDQLIAAYVARSTFAVRKEDR
jgi:hypothetical protein